MRFLTLIPIAALTLNIASAAPIATEETSLLTFLSSPYAVASSLISSLTTGTGVPSIATDDKEKTIWQLLNEDKDKFSKIVKLIELDPTAKKILDDRDTEVTFFAPENSGIPDPHHHDDNDDDDEEEDSAIAQLLANPDIPTLHAFHSVHLSGGGDDDDDEKKKERRKKIFLHILAAVLQYHGLAKPYSAADLAGNSTFETVLKGFAGASDGENLRIRVEKKLLPPSLELNFYAKVSGEKQAINGYLHSIDHPLFPPPSILDAAFLFPSKYSTLTSAVQKVHGAGFIGYQLDPEASKKEKKAIFRGAPATTLFAPTNEAFSKLPEKLTLFLFSPFGERVLAKLLAYHVLPEQILFSESYHSAHHHHKDEEAFEVLDGGYKKEAKLPTLLEGEKLKVVVEKKDIIPIIPGAVRTTITVNDIQAEVIDVPALNGAAHSLGDVLKPPHKHHDKESGLLVESQWKDWEHWLVDWAVESDFA